MRLGMIAAVIGISLASSAFAQAAWREYRNMDERFTINVPAEPRMTQGTFRSASGRALPTRVFTATNGPSAYSVTVVRYAGTPAAEFESALDHAVQTIRTRGGRVTSENTAHYEGFAARMLQVTNADATRSFIALVLSPPESKLERLYIVEGRVPATAPVPGMFQQSLSFIDADGVRLRYGTDVDGNKFRIIGDTCGFPYTRKGEKGVNLCDY